MIFKLGIFYLKVLFLIQDILIQFFDTIKGFSRIIFKPETSFHYLNIKNNEDLVNKYLFENYVGM